MQYLVLGGPAHGTMHEVEDGKEEIVVMGRMPDGSIMPVNYIVQTMEAQTASGIRQRTVLVPQGMPAQVATQFLEQFLLGQVTEQLVLRWFEGGEESGNTSRGDNSFSGNSVSRTLLGPDGRPV